MLQRFISFIVEYYGNKYIKAVRANPVLKKEFM